MKNDPFGRFETIEPKKLNYWNQKLGDLFTYRHDVILKNIVAKKKGGMENGKKRERITVNILELREEIDKEHKKNDPKGFARFKKLIQDRNILVVSVGGTILCKEDLDGFLRPTLTGQDIIGRLSSFIVDTYNLIETKPFEGLATGGIIQGLSPEGLMDSADMTSTLQLELARHIAEKITESKNKGEKILGVIVLHGTDTMASTAAALSLYFERLSIPIIMTGSMKAGEKDDTDAKSNLESSILFAASAPIKPGVYVCFDDRLYTGTRVIHDSADPKKAFRSSARGASGSTAVIKRGVWVEKDRKTRRTKALTLDEAKLRKLAEEELKEKEKGGERAPPDFKVYYTKRVAEMRVSLKYFGRGMGRTYPRIIDIKNTSPVLGVTTYAPSKHEITFKTVVKLFDLDKMAKNRKEWERAKRIEEKERADRVKGALNEGGIDYVGLGEDFSDIGKEETLTPLENRIGLIFRGFTGTEDTRIVLPLVEKAIPVVLGSRVRHDVVKNIFKMGEKYGTDEKLLKAGVIYSEDMVEEMLASKLSIVLGLLKENLTGYGRNDIINDPEKYLYFVKLLMLINYKGEVTIAIGETGNEEKLTQCKYSISTMAKYLAKNGYSKNERILFTKMDRYSEYFYMLRKFLGEKLTETRIMIEIPKETVEIWTGERRNRHKEPRTTEQCYNEVYQEIKTLGEIKNKKKNKEEWRIDIYVEDDNLDKARDLINRLKKNQRIKKVSYSTIRKSG